MAHGSRSLFIQQLLQYDFEDEDDEDDDDALGTSKSNHRVDGGYGENKGQLGGGDSRKRGPNQCVKDQVLEDSCREVPGGDIVGASSLRSLQNESLEVDELQPPAGGECTKLTARELKSRTQKFPTVSEKCTSDSTGSTKPLVRSEVSNADSLSRAFISIPDGDRIRISHKKPVFHREESAESLSQISREGTFVNPPADMVKVGETVSVTQDTEVNMSTAEYTKDWRSTCESVVLDHKDVNDEDTWNTSEGNEGNGYQSLSGRFNLQTSGGIDESVEDTGPLRGIANEEPTGGGADDGSPTLDLSPHAEDSPMLDLSPHAEEGAGGFGSIASEEPTSEGTDEGSPMLDISPHAEESPTLDFSSHAKSDAGALGSIASEEPTREGADEGSPTLDFSPHGEESAMLDLSTHAEADAGALGSIASDEPTGEGTDEGSPILDVSSQAEADAVMEVDGGSAFHRADLPFDEPGERLYTLEGQMVKSGDGHNHEATSKGEEQEMLNTRLNVVELTEPTMVDLNETGAGLDPHLETTREELELGLPDTSEVQGLVDVQNDSKEVDLISEEILPAGCGMDVIPSLSSGDTCIDGRVESATSPGYDENGKDAISIISTGDVELAETSRHRDCRTVINMSMSEVDFQSPVVDSATDGLGIPKTDALEHIEQRPETSGHGVGEDVMTAASLISTSDGMFQENATSVELVTATPVSPTGLQSEGLAGILQYEDDTSKDLPKKEDCPRGRVTRGKKAQENVIATPEKPPGVVSKKRETRSTSAKRNLKGPMVKTTEALVNPASVPESQDMAEATGGEEMTARNLQVDIEVPALLPPGLLTSPVSFSGLLQSGAALENSVAQKDQVAFSGLTPGFLLSQVMDIASQPNALLKTPSNNKHHGRAGASDSKSRKKQKSDMHHDTRTMVVVHPENHFRELSQYHAMERYQNTSLYGYSSVPQSSRSLVQIETDKQLLHAQTSAQDAMVAATSALAQSHCVWARIQSQTPQSPSQLTAMREAQISSVAASVAAAASVAKAAVDAAKAIQDASNEALNQLGMFHDIENYGQLQGTGTRSSARLAIGQGRTANPKPLQVASGSRTVAASTRGKSNSKAPLTIREPAVKRGRNSLASKGDQRLQIVVHGSRNNETMDKIEEGSVVEVMSEEEGLRGGWFSANVLMMTDKEALVVYDDLLSDDGRSQLKEWFPISCVREEETFGTTRSGVRRWMRPLHPSCNNKKRRRSSIPSQVWVVGDYVDAFIQDGWWEGVVQGVNDDDESRITVYFPGEEDTAIVKTKDVRPSLVWTDGEWLPRNGSHLEEGGPPSKRQKLAIVPAGKKMEDSKVKQKPTRKSVQDHKAISEPRRSRQSVESKHNDSRGIMVMYTGPKQPPRDLRSGNRSAKSPAKSPPKAKVAAAKNSRSTTKNSRSSPKKPSPKKPAVSAPSRTSSRTRNAKVDSHIMLTRAEQKREKDKQTKSHKSASSRKR